MASAVSLVADLEMVLRDRMNLVMPVGFCIECIMSACLLLALVKERQGEIIIIGIAVRLSFVIAVVDRMWNHDAIRLKPHLEEIAYAFLISGDVDNEFKRLAGGHEELVQLLGVLPSKRKHHFVRVKVVARHLLVRDIVHIIVKVFYFFLLIGMFSIEIFNSVL